MNDSHEFSNNTLNFRISVASSKVLFLENLSIETPESVELVLARN
jgi:hypothetical protein